MKFSHLVSAGLMSRLVMNWVVLTTACSRSAILTLRVLRAVDTVLKLQNGVIGVGEMTSSLRAK